MTTMQIITGICRQAHIDTAPLEQVARGPVLEVRYAATERKDVLGRIARALSRQQGRRYTTELLSEGSDMWLEVTL